VVASRVIEHIGEPVALFCRAFSHQSSGRASVGGAPQRALSVLPSS
jgi:hypothetical protein